MVLVSSVGKGSDSESFQLDVRVQAGAECTKIVYSIRMRIAQARVVPNYVGCNKPFDHRESR